MTFPYCAARAESQPWASRAQVPDMPDLPVGSDVTLVIRPEAMRLSAKHGDLKGTVLRSMFVGNIAEYLVEIAGIGEWLVESSNPAEVGLFDVGQDVFLSPLRSSIHVLEAHGANGR
jgi:iron(III) transport system ATP-binding protein